MKLTSICPRVYLHKSHRYGLNWCTYTEYIKCFQIRGGRLCQPVARFWQRHIQFAYNFINFSKIFAHISLLIKNIDVIYCRSRSPKIRTEDELPICVWFELDLLCPYFATRAIYAAIYITAGVPNSNLMSSYRIKLLWLGVFVFHRWWIK